MKKSVSAEIMKESDLATAATLEGGTRELMGRAGAALAGYAAKRSPRRVAIVSGPGGNGGDGYAAALCLHGLGIRTQIFSLSERSSADGEYYRKKCRALGLESEPITEKIDLSDFDVIVDCLFGIGFHGEPRGVAAAAIVAMNASDAFVISADINSGLNGNSGQGELAVRSDLTVAIGACKHGHFLGRAKDLIGDLVLEDVGIAVTDGTVSVADPGDLASAFPRRPHNSHKGTFGTAAVFGGSIEYSGALKLAAMSLAALRSGAGLSKIIAPGSIVHGLLPYVLESTIYPLPDEGGHVIFDKEAVNGALDRVTSLAIGMGWGKSGENERILSHILQSFSIALTVDADGLNTLAASKDALALLKSTRCSVVLTPHPAEFSRLSGRSVSEILSDPVGEAMDFAREYGCILLLKGTSTVVTDGKQAVIVTAGSPGMAKGGSGDVLSGVIAGVLAHAPATVTSVAAASHLCGTAGELAAACVGDVSAIASDTVRHIPDAIRSMRGE